jgi:transcriptional regulator with GAF, ATPase, and Fis domain
LADGATLFWDEIGELPLELQPKLLRVLQDGEFERLGSSRTVRVDVRVLAATNRDVLEEIRAGRFRQDLYYRLSVYPLSIPPLRAHPEDIPLLVQASVTKFSKKFGKRIKTIPPTTMQALQRYPWPGNIRELENVIERALITTNDQILRVDLPFELSAPAGDVDKSLEEIEQDYIRQILEKTGGKIEGRAGAARILGLHHSTLRSRMQKLGIKRM